MSIIQGETTNWCTHADCVNISKSRRAEIVDEFKRLNFRDRQLFILNHTDCRTVTNRRQRVQNQEERKQQSLTYFLYDETCCRRKVCRKFFLQTLCISQTVIYATMKRNTRTRFLPNDHGNLGISRTDSAIAAAVDEHILSYNPEESHYRIIHAPHRLYLSHELTIAFMYRTYNEQLDHELDVSYTYYRERVNKLNISFAKLGNEQCETCDQYTLGNGITLEFEKEYKAHKERSAAVRQLYRSYAERTQVPTDDTLCVSVDMEKVMLVPHMSCYKTTIFTSRLSIYNETFVPIGEKSIEDIVACIWHEGVSGRNKEDLVSAFHQFFLHHRHRKNIVVFLDNCSAQNKNWCLLTYLVFIINSEFIETETISFIFLEPGHTFMSADSFHHQVEDEVRKRGKLFDYYDFISAVESVNNRVRVKNMDFSDFYAWIDGKMQRKQDRNPEYRLRNIVNVQAQRGSYFLFYKKTHSNSEKYEVLDFLHPRYMNPNGMVLPAHKLYPCGISREKKEKIIKSLVNLMPKKFHVFWQSLSDTSDADLQSLLSSQ